MMLFKTLRAHGVEIFAGAAIGWAVLLVLLDLGGSLLPQGGAAPASREESAAAKQLEADCTDIGGVEVCE